LNGDALPERPDTEDARQEIVHAAGRQGLAPLLWRRLSRRTGGPALPPRFLNQLREAYLTNAASTVLHLQELGRVLRGLDAAGIPAIVLKGLCLSETVYGNIALRTMGDADVMVHPADMERAVSVMRELGFTSDSVFDLDAYMDQQHHLPPFTRAGRLTVELHWTFVQPIMGLPFTRSDLDGVWARSVPISLGGAPARSLCPEDMLIHLCFHASAQHLFLSMGLRACFDIAEVLTRYQDALDWDQLQQRALAWKLHSSVALTLTLAREFANAAAPPSVLEGLGSEALPEKIVEQARSNICNPTEIDAAITASEHLVEFGNASLLGRLRVLFNRAFPSRREMAVLYPAAHSRWICLYYPLRWRDALLRHKERLIQLTWQERWLRNALHKQQALIHWLRPKS
jgi:hypothetical protein